MAENSAARSPLPEGGIMTGITPKAQNTITFKTVDRLKETLITEGLLTQDQLKAAMRMAQEENESLGKILIKSNLVSEEQLLDLIGQKIHIPYMDIKKYTLDRHILDRLPENIVRRYNVIPLFEIEGVLTVAMSDPLNLRAYDELCEIVRCEIDPVIASRESIELAIEQWYGTGIQQDLIDQLSEEFRKLDIAVEERGPAKFQKEADERRARKEAEEPLVVKLVNNILVRAILENASDIHIEPKKNALEARFRIDGLLYKRYDLSTELIPTITSRIKLLSELDIANRRIPQDGRMSFAIRDRTIDIRCSVIPSLYGENIVLRLLDKSKGAPKLSTLGFSAETLEIFKNLFKATKGIILATGPTGCGKTTSILSAITALNSPDKNLMTIEDPVEYAIDGIVQSQVNLKTDFTFANALRHFLRQDPDIIYVGEIRDTDTAEIAIRAALTGHLVLSSLHTNDAVGAITRLRDMGVERGLIASTLKCSFAQRLVRTICPRCVEEYQPDPILLKDVNFAADTKFHRGRGCGFCNGIGYKGRIGIFEVLVVDKKIQFMITEGAADEKILEAARAEGMKSLYEAGLLKVKDGITTLEELQRVTMD